MVAEVDFTLKLDEANCAALDEIDAATKLAEMIVSMPKRFQTGKVSLKILRHHYMDEIEDIFNLCTFFEVISENTTNFTLYSFFMDIYIENQRKNSRLGLVSTDSFIHILKHCKNIEMNQVAIGGRRLNKQKEVGVIPENCATKSLILRETLLMTKFEGAKIEPEVVVFEQARVLLDNAWIDGRYIRELCLSSGPWRLGETKFTGRTSILVRAISTELADMVSLKKLDLDGMPMREVISDVHSNLPLQKLDDIKLGYCFNNIEVELTELLKFDFTRKCKQTLFKI